MVALPPISTYMEPVLHVLVERGGRATNEELNAAVAARVGLSDEQLRMPHGKGDGRSEFEYRMAWARTKLRKAGDLEPDQRKAWRITEAGRAKISATSVSL
jgi:restriction endonuclease Mrr